MLLTFLHQLFHFGNEEQRMRYTLQSGGRVMLELGWGGEYCGHCRNVPV